MGKFARLVALVLVATVSGPLGAETLDIASYRPAQTEAAVGLSVISVERFGGSDGARFSLLLGDSLREAQVAGRDWFTVLVAARAADADAVLEGFAEPRFSEQGYRQKREICWARDKDDNCIERREVEVDCLRVTVSLRPEIQLVGRDGVLLWSGSPERSEQFSYCPNHDTTPSADPVIDRLLEGLASDVRYVLVPSWNGGAVRIMESRSGLDRSYRNAFRDAVALTKTDQDAACAEFLRLQELSPDQDSLLFNTGLCAERDGAADTAVQFYERALASERSDDEAQIGIARIADTRRAQDQIARHFGE